MRLVFALVLMAGIGLAGFAVYMAQNYMSDMSAERDKLLAAQAASPPMVDVVVVKTDKEYGQVLKKEDVKWMRWQKDSLPKGVFVRETDGLPDFALDSTTLFPEGKRERFVITSMQKFEPLLAHKVTNPGEDAGLTSRLGKGMRAFAIRVDVSSGVSGFLRPGDRVDVYWTGSAAELEGTGEVTKLIESSVKLIAVDQIADTARTTPVIARTVTVEASPQEVAQLTQAQSTGKLSLSLVGAEDDTIAEVSQVDQRTLLGIIEKAPVVVEQERVCTTKIRRGSEVIVQEIPCTN
ncbi:Flp pilus assembly protein CpaB [Aliiruegeria sabulilitoris]|uniref:Flp pilus assembly protein CpaB n=1 Tax=Aliiruegeria sabulilitoris TaxID=1510458 RepID=UPI0008313A0A|nr:Flp pilus assembly protein CpaB [Aliiruegeria sabulilitoris]NDR57248.1 Flp pilus assembly protein CpaB [Pseudoruegeria sp. M32A2M]